MKAPASDHIGGIPAIGQPFDGGIFVGFTLDGEGGNAQRAALVLLPGDEAMPWKKATAWAKEQGGVLPSRIDMLVLFKNLPKEFQRDWYWTEEELAGGADSAWLQSFGYGCQSYGLKCNGCRCRAVRRVAI